MVNNTKGYPMNPKEWRKGEKLSQGEVAAKLTASIKPAKPYRQSHVSGWEKGAMPDALVGEAYLAISKGKVRAGDFVKPTDKEETHG
jgi:transcriptional regulator with XRE-family HTH domain